MVKLVLQLQQQVVAEAVGLGALEPLVKGFCEAREIGLGKVAQPIRVSMTGTKTGPGLYEMLVAAGKEMAIRRIRTGATKSPPAES